MPPFPTSLFFFFNDTATTEIYTLSLHDALPISHNSAICRSIDWSTVVDSKICCAFTTLCRSFFCRSEEHTSELQSHLNLVCRLLLEKKKNETSPQFYTSHQSRLSYIIICAATWF